jgi:membrane glycosyltransferase
VRRLGFLAIPEERIPPSIVDRFDELTTNAKPVLEEQSQLWRELLTDSQLSTIHRDLLSEPRLVPRGQIDVDLVVGLAKLDQCTTIDEALEILTSSEKRALLGNREAFDRLKALQKDQ